MAMGVVGRHLHGGDHHDDVFFDKELLSQTKNPMSVQGHMHDADLQGSDVAPIKSEIEK